MVGPITTGGDFSFLANAIQPQDQEDPANSIAPSMTGEGPKQKQDQFIKQRASLEDSIKKASQEGVGRLSAQMGSTQNRVNPTPTFNPDDLSLRLGGAHPDQHAAILEKEIGRLTSVPPGGSPAVIDSRAVLDPVEQATIAYRKFLKENAARQTQAQQVLAAQDLPQAQGRAQQIQAELKSAKDELALAPTQELKTQIQSKIQFLSQQAQQANAKAAQAQSQMEAPLDKNLNMDAVFTAAGLPRRDAIQAMTEMRRFVELHGIQMTDPVTPSTWPVLHNNLMSEIFKPEIAAKMQAEIAGQKKQEQEQELPPQKSPFGTDQLEQDPRYLNIQRQIQEHEARRNQVWQELAHSGTFKNVGDAIGFLLTSFLVGPRVGAMFFSNMQKNGNLRYELDQLNHESNALYHQQNSYMQLSQHARAMAAQEQHERVQTAETERHHVALEAYARMKTADKAAFTPEEKQVDLALQHSYRYQRANLDSQEKKVLEMGKVLDRGPIDPDFKTVQSAIGQERQKLVKQRGDFDAWREKANNWYRSHGAGDIEPAQPRAGDSLTMP